MSRRYIPVSDHRFRKSPFFECNDRDDTLYGIYNNRLYPISSGIDTKAHYANLRSNCCLYDVPETPLRITGKDSLPFLEKLFTRSIEKIKIGKAGYAVACNDKGGVIMDGVLLRPNEKEYIYVQANGDFLNWASAQRQSYEAEIEDFDSWVLQVQGPTSLAVLEAISGVSESHLPYYGVTEVDIIGSPFIISRSGWTGERGFEIYSRGSNFDGRRLWAHILEKGARHGLVASDVSSMHVRRIEAGILDYGTDIDSSLNPFEIGLGRLVHLDKREFIGRDALVNTSRTSLRLVGITCDEHDPERGDLLTMEDGTPAGTITAGAFSYTLERGIGFARLLQPASDGTNFFINTSSGTKPCISVDLPFIDKEKLLVR